MAHRMTVNLADPRVQQVLGTPGVYSGKPDEREVVHLAGDAPDPTGFTHDQGLLSTHRMTASRQHAGVVVQGAGLIMTVDVYTPPGEPAVAYVVCPRCHKTSRIQGDQKRIMWDPLALNPQRQVILEASRACSDETERVFLAGLAQFGRLSIEPFECTWEVGTDRHVAGAHHTGASLCRLRLVIDDNRAREV